MIGSELLEKYVIIRTYSAGVHMGILKDKSKDEVSLENSRRIYEWSGALSCSELAQIGPTIPTECKISCITNKILLLGVIEIIEMSTLAIHVIMGIPAWKKQA